MPDPIRMFEAMIAAAATAAVLSLLCAWPWRTVRPGLAAAGSALGVGLGFYVGYWLLGLRPHWPPREDQDRFVFFLFPAIIVVELVAAFSGRFRWTLWLLRFAIALSAAPVLLYNSSYLTELAGPGTREWTPALTWLILGSMAAALVAVWLLLALLVRSTSPHALSAKQQNTAGVNAVPLAVAVACAGAAVTIMLSGYASGGQVGLPLGAAVGGASLILRQASGRESALSLAIVGLFALLVMGRFFGELTTLNAVLLFFGPLLCWLSQWKYVYGMRPWLRSLVVLLLAAIPVAIALTLAQQKFISDSAGTSPGSQEPSIQDTWILASESPGSKTQKLRSARGR
jgi:hypothetical protein